MAIYRAPAIRRSINKSDANFTDHQQHYLAVGSLCNYDQTPQKLPYRNCILSLCVDLIWFAACIRRLHSPQCLGILWRRYGWNGAQWMHSQTLKALKVRLKVGV